ncbi:MAG: WecB/TagA/CpsF family glycosyltransferase [Planctomycetes bacterium]|nr:WecB/TagA/CpsF family glycosyltransferase [Planctomycetota bacterium]
MTSKNNGGVSPLVLFGIPLQNMTQEETVAWIVDRARSGVPGQVVTANLDFALQARRDPEMHRIQLEGDLVVPDGMPLVWLSRWFGPALKDRVAGSDLVPRLAEAARDNGLSLYAVGSAPGVAEKVMRLLQEQYPGLRVAGWESPPLTPFLDMDHRGIARRIQEAKPDIVLVAFGAPKQEKWIRLHLRDMNAPVAIGVGASLDFLAGEQVRAPQWIQNAGMEWFWRMAREPRRLAKRYAEDLLFLARMLARLAWLRLKPAEARRVKPPDPARIAALGAVWAVFSPLRRAADAEDFFRTYEPVTQERSLVLDLSRTRWLNSLELGALVRLGRVCRRRNRRLYLFSAIPRVRELILLYQLNRYVELAPTMDKLERGLERLRSAEHFAVRVNRTGHRLQVLLPEEFGRDVAPPAQREVHRHWGSGSIRELVIDASRTTYLDSAGVLFISETGRLADRPDRGMWLRGFGEPLMKILHRERVNHVRLDRRKRFRWENASAEQTALVFPKE